MKAQKEPVIYVIEGTSFEVDVAHQLLRQTNDKNNVISFTLDMQDHGTYYHLLYDLDKHQPQAEIFDEKRIRTIQIPQMTELDPEGMAAAYGKSLEAVLGHPDYDVIVNAELVSKRHQGVLPVIEIAGDLFIVDLRLKELRHITDLTNHINLQRLNLSDTGDEYLFFYHVGQHQVAELDPKLTEFPDQVVLAKIPNEVHLDPISTAETYGIDERQLLRRFPIINGLKASIVPLADTGVPALISRNRAALKKEHDEIVANRKPRKGLRL